MRARQSRPFTTSALAGLLVLLPLTILLPEAAAQTVVDFDSPKAPGKLDGVFEGIDWGQGQWRTWHGFCGACPPRMAYMTCSPEGCRHSKCRDFSFVEPRILLSFSASAHVEPGNLTLRSFDAGGNTLEELGPILITKAECAVYETGWVQPASIVEVCFQFGSDLAFDDVTYAKPAPVVTIESPVHLATFGSSPISVSGTVDDVDAVLTVNGVQVPINPDGTYSVDGIVIKEGGNTIIATAINQMNKVGTANVQVYLDSTAPAVTITYPENGSTVTSSPITVTGTIFDIVKGEVNQENASVEVNGITAEVSNKSYIAKNVPLVEGDNLITATGADQMGNVTSTSVNVYLDLSADKTISMVSGDNQAGPINSLLPDPLVAALKNADGSPAPGTTVIFKVVQNNGSLNDGAEPSSATISLAQETDANGQAKAYFTLGSTAGVGNNKVEAVAVGFTGKVVFAASGLIGVAHKINIGSGDDQRGAVSAPLPKPLVAVVTDAGHNPVQGVPVIFKVHVGGGQFGEASEIVVPTDSDGRATASLTLGPEPGLDNNIVEVTFEGNQTGAAIFSASGLPVGDPGETKIAGVVLDNSNNPIPGVTMHVEGTTRTDVTNEEGQFLIENVPVGALHLIADGSTATLPGEYPVLGFEIDAVAGQTNTLGMPIYLLPLNTSTTQWVGGNEDVVYKLEDIPGFSLTITANSVTFPDGSHEGFISVTQVHADKVPMAPPNGLQPRFIITIQPPGVVFDPPAPLTLPNVDGYPPGHITEMYSFDHDLGQFVSIGTATVSEDGTVLRSDPGMGVIKAGWHCGGDPAGGGCVEACGTCKKCNSVTCACEADKDQDPGMCKKCDRGAPVNDDDEVPEPDNPCKECKGGVVTNKPDGPLAGDKCKTCNDGVASEIVLPPSVSYSESESFPLDFVSKANAVLAPLGATVSNPTVEVTGTLAPCCDPEDGINLAGKPSLSTAASMSATIDFRVWPPGPKLPKIAVGITTPLATVLVTVEIEAGLYAGGTAEFSGQIEIVGDLCEADVCTQAQVGLSFVPQLDLRSTAEICIITDCLFCEPGKTCSAAGVTGGGNWEFFGGLTYNKPECGDGLKGIGFGNNGLTVFVTASASITINDKEYSEEFTAKFGPFFASAGNG